MPPTISGSSHAYSLKDGSTGWCNFDFPDSATHPYIKQLHSKTFVFVLVFVDLLPDKNE